MDLKNIDLLSLQTSQMQQDPTVIALCSALNPQFQELGEEVTACLIYSRIDYLSDEILDELAWQMNVDWYDSTANIDVKRNLLKNSIRLHRIKGTPQAIIDAATTVFGKTKLQEWFEYGGNPYYFKMDVDVTETGASPAELKKLDALIDAYKNKRSWLEMLNIYLTTLGTLSIGTISIDAEEIAVYPWSPKDIDTMINYTIPVAQSAGNETITTYPKEAI